MISSRMTIPARTLAVRLFEYGGPDKLVVGEYDLPPLGERDVLVKNHAGSVSRWDVKYRAGDLARYQIPGRAPFPLPQQLGREAAGEVIATGGAVTRFKPGDRVIGVTHPEDPHSIEFARGLGNLSRKLAIPGHQAFGSYAQYLVRDEAMWLPLPDNVDFEQAGVALWPFSSSHRVVADRLRVKLGDNVLITGASGGMGQATLQLAKLAGARGHFVFEGTPEQVTDLMQEWVTEGVADGFNLMPPVLPEMLDVFIAEVVPILQRRGLFRTAYTGTTLRDHLGLERPVSPWVGDLAGIR